MYAIGAKCFLTGWHDQHPVFPHRGTREEAEVDIALWILTGETPKDGVGKLEPHGSNPVFKVLDWTSNYGRAG